MLKQLGNFATVFFTVSPRVALRYKMIAASIAILCFISPFTHAKTQILLNEGYEISFDGGKFDAETFFEIPKKSDEISSIF